MPVAQTIDTRELVLSFFPAEKRTSTDVQTLASLLEGFFGAEVLSDRIDAFIQLRAWTTRRGPSPSEDGQSRLETFLSLME